jgi:hypothetical protein
VAAQKQQDGKHGLKAPNGVHLASGVVAAQAKAQKQAQQPPGQQSGKRKQDGAAPPAKVGIAMRFVPALTENPCSKTLLLNIVHLQKPKADPAAQQKKDGQQQAHIVLHPPSHPGKQKQGAQKQGQQQQQPKQQQQHKKQPSKQEPEIEGEDEDDEDEDEFEQVESDEIRAALGLGSSDDGLMINTDDGMDEGEDEDDADLPTDGLEEEGDDDDEGDEDEGEDAGGTEDGEQQPALLNKAARQVGAQHTPEQGALYV